MKKLSELTSLFLKLAKPIVRDTEGITKDLKHKHDFRKYDYGFEDEDFGHDDLEQTSFDPDQLEKYIEESPEEGPKLRQQEEYYDFQESGENQKNIKNLISCMRIALKIYVRAMVPIKYLDKYYNSEYLGKNILNTQIIKDLLFIVNKYNFSDISSSVYKIKSQLKTKNLVSYPYKVLELSQMDLINACNSIVEFAQNIMEDLKVFIESADYTNLTMQVPANYKAPLIEKDNGEMTTPTRIVKDLLAKLKNTLIPMLEKLQVLLDEYENYKLAI